MNQAPAGTWPPITDEEQLKNARLMHRIQAQGIREAQRKEAEAAKLPSEPVDPRYGTMAPAAMYHELPVVDDDDLYFLGEPFGQPPFYVTPKPAYFDEYEAACRQDQVATLQQIISQNSLTPAMLHHGLTLAISTGNVASASELFRHGAPLTQRTPENILCAPPDKQVLLLELLTTQGWEPSHEIFLQSIGNIDVLRWFLSHGTDPNFGIKRDRPGKHGGPSHECADALEKAAASGNVEAIEILIEAGAKIAYGHPLHCAACALPPRFRPYLPQAMQPEDFDVSRIPAMAALVKHGADVNQREDTPYVTPEFAITYAVSNGAVQRARWLLEHGADPTMTGPYGSAVEYVTTMGSDAMKEVFQAWIHPSG